MSSQFCEISSKPNLNPLNYKHENNQIDDEKFMISVALILKF